MSSVIIRVGFQCLTMQTIFMPTVFRILNFIARRQHASIIEKCQSIDDDFARLGVAINYSQHYLVSVVVSAFYYGFFLLVIVVDEQLNSMFSVNTKTDVVPALFAMLNISSYLSYQISHMLIVTTMYSRFRYLNQFVERSVMDRQLMICIARLLNKLNETLDLMNSCFAINLLNYFFQFIIFSVFFFFSLYHSVTAHDANFRDFILNIISGFWLLFFLWYGAWMVIMSNWLKVEGANTKLVIHSKEVTDPICLKTFNLLCLQLEHSTPLVTSGLFHIDWPYLFTFISALFSYLIILIQFETG
jgi:7tm Chemosensory receptor